MYRICFDFTRKYFWVSSLLDTKHSEILLRKIRKNPFWDKLGVKESRCVLFSKAQGLTYSKLCLKPHIFTAGLKEPEHKEKYVSLPAKTEKMV